MARADKGGCDPDLTEEILSRNSSSKEVEGAQTLQLKPELAHLENLPIWVGGYLRHLPTYPHLRHL
jgi:hypothetical protein